MLRTDLGNFFLLHYRSVDGFLITGKNCGTHWLKWMLSHAMARHYDLPPPEFSSGAEADAFIGHPKHGQRHPELPWIGSSHNIPSLILAWPIVRHLFPLPPTVVLVRDIREALLSHYLKRGETYGLTLDAYLRLPPPGRRRITDVWWYVAFFNRWSSLAQAMPDRILVVRYEQLQAAPEYWLGRIAAHYDLSLKPEALTAGLAVASRGSVRDRLAPTEPETIVPAEARRASLTLSPSDEAMLNGILQRWLTEDFGYGYLETSHRPIPALPESAG
jgi:hypothetical protein